MRYVLIGLVLCSAQGSGPAVSPYASRRAELRKALPDGVVVLFGRGAKDYDDVRSGFYQEPNFYYLTGWNEPGAALALSPAGDMLFRPARDAEKEKWTGPKPAAPADFEHVFPIQDFEAKLAKLRRKYPRLYALKDAPGTAKLGEFSDARAAIARLRMKKSPEEIAAIEHATEVSVAAQLAGWKRAAPGLYEYQIAATMTAVFGEHGCERPAYTPIVGSGPNAVFMHYAANKRRMDGGEILLMDVAAECSAYASDITRTIPVSGKFSARQREIYDVVLGAQRAAIAAVKPGMSIAKDTPGSLYQIAYDYINSHGKDLHGERLGRYFSHGLSHHVGLEVHDASDAKAPLEAGMVITVEPGIYLPEENFGVRIEDIVLVTENGARVLSGRLPKAPDEIEKAIAR